MPIVHYATARVHSPRPFPMQTAAATTAAVGLIANDGGWLAQAGWSKNLPGSTYCTANFFVPFGFGLSTWFCMVDGVVYQIVTGGGPPSQPAGPGTPINIGQILNFDLTVNEGATAANLAAGIQTYSQFNATAVFIGGYWNIALTAKNPGPVANLSDIEGTSTVLATNNRNGAWQWLSQANPVGSQVGILLSAAGYGSANLLIQQQYIGVPASGPVPLHTSAYYLAWRNKWQFRADSYSLAFWVAPAEDEGGHGGDGNGGNSFYYAGVPRHCQVVFGATPSGGISSAFSYWGTRAAFHSTGNGDSLFMGDFVTTNIGGCGFSIAAPVSNNMPNCGKAGAPLILDARVGLPYASGEMKLVGWLYEAIVVADQFPLDSSPADQDGTYVQYDGHTWVAIMAQAGATLFLCWD